MTRISTDSTGRWPRAITRPSRGSSNSAAGRRSVAAYGLALALLAMLPSCQAEQPALLIIPADRTVRKVECLSGSSGLSGSTNETNQKNQTNLGTCYVVTAAWLQERYELERALQLALDRCESGAGQKPVTRYASQVTEAP